MFDVTVGTAHVVWPEATAERSTVSLILDVDPIALVRGKGNSPYVDLLLSGPMRLADALRAPLYVLLPVLDDSKHYWVSTDEVDKLLRAGGGWLAGHPERDLITRRYLKHQRALVLSPVGRLAEVDDAAPEQLDNAVPDEPDAVPTPLVQLRKRAVLDALVAEGASTVVDLGCGEGGLLRELIGDPGFSKVLGADVSHRALEAAVRRLDLDRMPDSQRARLELIQSSATYRDERLVGHDAVVLMEVIEHIDPGRLPALERNIFGCARPRSVFVTTPNASSTCGTSSSRRARCGTAITGSSGPAAEVGSPTQLGVFRRFA